MIRVKREELLTQLEFATPGLSQREIVEQSSCFVFKDGNVITFNEEIACQHESCIGIEGAVPAEPLLAILRKLVEDEVEIIVEDGELIVKGQKRRAGIRMEKEILLPVDSIEKPKKWKPLHEDFGDAISIVQQCAGKDESKFFLTCVHISPEYLESCDNTQASRYNLETGFKKDCLVRRDSIKHVTSTGMTEFSETDTWIHFRNPAGLILSCRRFVEEYPDLTSTFEINGEPTVLPKGLGEAADKAEVFSAEDADNNRVLVELKPGKLRIRGQGASGWYSEIKDLKYNGEAMSFLIAPKLLIELVKRHTECEISPERLKVDGGHFIFITCLGKVT